MTMLHRIDAIVSDPDVRNGQPMIAGTRIRLIDLVTGHLYRGLSPDELAVNYALTLSQVYAALAYYYQNKRDVDALLRNDIQETKRLMDVLQKQGKLTIITRVC